MLAQVGFPHSRLADILIHALWEVPVQKYLALIRLLISFGTKLPTVWPKILQVIELIRSIAADLGVAAALEPSEGGTLGLEAECQDSAVLNAEAQVGQLLAAERTQAAFDGTRLRRLWKFFEDSGLADMLLGLLKGLLASAAK